MPPEATRTGPVSPRDKRRVNSVQSGVYVPVKSLSFCSHGANMRASQLG